MSLPLDLRYGDIQCSLTEVHPGCETRFSDNAADGRSASHRRAPLGRCLHRCIFHRVSK